MKKTALILAALLMLGFSASAQIAAPQLNPMAYGTFGDTNPAVLSWGSVSVVGVGHNDITVEFTPLGGPTYEYADGGGPMAELRFTGESWGVGFDMFHFDLTIDPLFGGGGDFVIDNKNIGLSFSLGDIVSIGVGQERQHQEEPFRISTETLPLAGVSIKIGGMFYVGAAAGTETVETEDPSVAGSFEEGDRSVGRVGVAFHTRDETSGFHLEAYVSNSDGITTINNNNDAIESKGVILEMVFADFLLGYERLDLEHLDATTNVLNQDQRAQVVSLGYTPMMGFNLVASSGSYEITESGGNFIEFQIKTVGVAWSF